MRFKLSGNIITGPVVITDIEVIGRPLNCQSERTTSQSPPPAPDGNWYLHPERQSTDPSDRIGNSDRGWLRIRSNTPAGNRQVKLRKETDTGAAVEGRFTCQIDNDINPIRSLYVLYPSELGTSLIVLLSNIILICSL